MADASLAEQNGAMRAAVAALHTNGSCLASLRMPGLAASGDDTEQLGLATPVFQDLSLGPVAFSKANSNTKVTIAAAAVLALTQSLAFDAANVLFTAAAGVLIEGELYLITNIATAEAHGRPYSYTLALEPPAH